LIIGQQGRVFLWGQYCIKKIITGLMLGAAKLSLSALSVQAAEFKGVVMVRGDVETQATVGYKFDSWKFYSTT
jgi:hypothetical protein